MISKKPHVILRITSSNITTINPLTDTSSREVDNQYIPPLPSQQMPRNFHEDETVKQAKDSLMRTNYCSLAKAAEITRRTENQLLALGETGHLTFVTPLPPSINLNPVNEEKRLWSIPDPEDFPALLVLDGTDCDGLKLNSGYKQGSFSKVISPFSGETVLPIDGDTQYGGVWIWRTFVHSSLWYPTDITITRDRVYVMRNEYLSELSIGSNGLPHGYLSMKECIALTGLGERTIDYKTNIKEKRYDKDFPQKNKLSIGRVGFKVVDVQIWIDNRPKK